MRELKKGSQANPGGRSIDTALRKAAYVGVWGPGSMWGLNNVLLGGHAEVGTDENNEGPAACE